MPRVPSLRRLREARLMSQQDLATRAGVGRPTISRLENDRMPARFITIRKLAAALSVEPTELTRSEVRGARGRQARTFRRWPACPF